MSLPPATLSVPAPERSAQGSLVTVAAVIGMMFHLVVAHATIPPPGVVRWAGSLPASVDLGFTVLDPRLLGLVLMAPFLARMADTAGARGRWVPFACVATAIAGLVASTGSLPHLGTALGLTMTLVVTTGSARLAGALGLLASAVGLYFALQVASVASLSPVPEPLTGALRSGPHLPGLAPLGGIVTFALPLTVALSHIVLARDLPASPRRTLVRAVTNVMGFDAAHRVLRLLHAAATGRAWERFTRLDTGDVLAYALVTGLVLWATMPRPTMEPTRSTH